MPQWSQKLALIEHERILGLDFNASQIRQCGSCLDDAVETEERLDFVVDEESLRDRRRVCHARGLDDDPVELQAWFTGGLAAAANLAADKLLRSMTSRFFL